MTAPPTRRRWRRPLTVAASLAAHVLVLYAVLSGHVRTRMEPQLRPLTTAVLIHPRPPVPPAKPTAPEPAPAAPAKPAPPKPPPPRSLDRPPRPAPPDIKPIPVAKGPPSDAASEVSDAQLAAAAGAGAGAGSGAGGTGGGCDMIRWLQQALRKDRLVQAAVAANPPGKAIMVWNGDWVRRTGQDGNGLAAVREAMMWEIAFAPAACRSRPVHGLVLISLADGPGGARLVLGAGDWRWSDLLQAHRGVPRG